MTKFAVWLLKNRVVTKQVSYCWRIISAIDEVLCLCIVNNHVCECWTIASTIALKACGCNCSLNHVAVNKFVLIIDCRNSYCCTIVAIDSLTGFLFNPTYPFVFALVTFLQIFVCEYFDYYYISQFRITVKLAFTTILSLKTIFSLFHPMLIFV